MRIVFYIISLCCIALGVYAYYFIMSLNLDSVLWTIGVLILYCMAVNLFVRIITKIISTFTRIQIDTDDCYYSKAAFAVAYMITIFIISGNVTEYELLGRIIVTIIVSLPPIIINMYLAYPKDDSYSGSYNYSSNYSSSYSPSSYSSYSSYSRKPKDETIRVERTLFGDKIYRDSSGKVVARGERSIFGDEIIRDNKGNEIMRGETDYLFGGVNYRDKSGNKTYRKEVGFFGDNIIRDNKGDVKYREEFDFFGDSKIRKK